ncbi:DUF6907 domain-containing protein [Streptomyces sp. WAC01280]|uniref:DUF6907 domain-containing protein n=1 Tax=Streptomyces sp. WAC01280 TaxID=2487424 RepID=UPI000F77351D|nr:hypothetical protein [Streptomyces sp. WAC01280]RSS53025.1 hypothetical protein EF909_26220 [Streptomyces sp. WAC01280]
MSDRDPLEGIPAELLDWHKGALEGDAAVCAAPQPGRDGFPCIHNRAYHDRHRDVLGRTWPFFPDEPLTVAHRAPVADGMVTVETADHGPVVLPEPSWCTGHKATEAYREDIEHQSVEQAAAIPTLCHGAADVLAVQLVQRPFSPSAPQVHAVLNASEDLHALNSAGLDVAAGVLVEHAATLRHLARQLAALEVQR